MTRQALVEQIRKKKSFLCVGLDTDLHKIPKHLLKEEDPLFAFNKQIIDATIDLCVAYKPNLAFYESLGAKGWESLQKTIEYLPDEIFTIADAKRGDIGNTSTMYARAFFEQMKFDSVTVAPYMGADSVTPFLQFDNKWVILLALTSNPGSHDFQQLTLKNEDEKLYERVLKESSLWGTTENLMYVVGATRAEALLDIRKIIPDHFLLVPGVGAQGGSLKEVAKYGMNDDIGLLVNASRSIIYAGKDQYFAKASRIETHKLQQEMATYL
ncbi:orotidine-5'-phosphate decarboxylase [Catalinimonas niigatensis]|uniref:orotidine-5'-phosphate decarboxylase n=1 Tax=Catalinimonas niigatensis TaxID=1397264 RepID=UPI002664ED14|nr:orotidine-5'-phosphate decarboxylase [Catalinimonas niigatensis]WPP53731.1 orotidine-5'-phosphate decarboxylase [Catalinimonas niigatensis]